jgi:endonuclease-3
MSASRRTRQSKLKRILHRLQRLYGRRAWQRKGSGIDVLVASMLAQNTNMTNAVAGFRHLKRRFTSWTQVMNADIRDVQREIAICGLARMRARRLQNLLRTIKQQQRKLDIEFLATRPPREGYSYLTSFFGIGPKTAAYTLLFSFNLPVFPVDKGIHRMCRRLSLVRPRAGEAETERVIELHAPPGDVYPLHVLMFDHAKKLCRPRNPKCGECPLVEDCPFGRRRTRHLPPKALLPPIGKMRRVILSRFASDGLAKDASRENDDR